MGSVLVEAMAQGSIGEPQSKQPHPFFARPLAPAVPSLVADASPHNEGDGHSAIESTDGDESKKRRQIDAVASEEGPEAKKQRRKRKSAAPPNNSSILDHLTPVNRQVDAPAATDIEVPSIQQPFIPPTEALVSPPEAIIPETGAPVVASSEPYPTATKLEAPLPETPDPSKKVLKLNLKTGTLRSPPKPQPKPTRIVCIKYGRDDQHRKDVSEKIAQILDGSLKLPVDPSEPPKKKRGRPPKDGASTKVTAAKPKHDFFAGKQKPVAAQPASAGPPKRPQGRSSVFMSTPVSPRKPRASMEWSKVPTLGSKPSEPRVPGSQHALWPPLDMCHVRGEEPLRPRVTSPVEVHTTRKSKGQAIEVGPYESVVDQLASRLNISSICDSLPRDPDKFPPAPHELRLPTRHFESGRKLQKRIRPQLRTLNLDSLSDQVQSSPGEPTNSRRRQTHEAVAKHYNSLATSLSAYDRSTCDTLSWIQKYAPASALEVLQVGKEAILLKQWLEALEVKSVDTGSNGPSGGKNKTKGDEVPKKRRKRNKLDGFIVDSDDEADELYEISDNEEDWNVARAGTPQRTVVRNGNGKSQVRPPNAVLVSGPHGSGKTAAVYAVAKELGFEVFEIHAGSRRSGKDILEKVGDMTRNHLVHHKTQPASGANTDTEDSVARDLKSGKQGTMMSFFKPKPAPASNKTPQPQQTEKKAQDAPKSSASRAQKQSLVLLEEVDILFEEDKQFWATLMELMAQSKRPFIMTCNDEKLVPLHNLKLHGILRFSPPPVDMAVDLCLLVAANEGHALQRSSVQALYESRCHDLRATLSELNYWCQIGVGDRRGGFDWFYLRWPKGSDLDENGDVVRVISEDTYIRGMGWVGRDPMVMARDTLDTELESFHQGWDAWKLDMDDWRGALGIETWASNAGNPEPRAPQHLADLSAYSAFCDSMSDADVCSGGFSMTRLQELVDPSLPELPVKAREDFIVGRTLLEADPVVLQSSPHVSMAMSVSSLAKAHLRENRQDPSAQPTSGAIKLANEETSLACIESSLRSYPDQLTRMDIAYAFDPIAISAKSTSLSHLDPSVFDQTMKLIVLDVAPWVRGIVAYDQRLMTDRVKLSNLLSEGGKRKRMRKTRAAISALEGGERGSTRRESYFGDCLTTGYVMRTGGCHWQDAIPVTRTVEDEGQEQAPSSPISEGSSVQP